MTRPERDRQVAVEPERLGAILTFLQEAERLKDTLRSGRTRQGRAESTAEHTWPLCLMSMLFDRELEGIDPLRLARLLVVHDLGEAISGDIPAVAQHGDPRRTERERADLIHLCSSLPGDLHEMIVELWDDYATAALPRPCSRRG